MKKRYLIPSLFAAGIAPLEEEALALPANTAPGADEPSKNLLQLFNQDHRYTLAGHSSHSSHASHASHASHRSSGSYSYTPPAYTPPPVYTEPPVDPTPIVPAQPAAPSTAPSQLLTLPGNSNKFKNIVFQVQLALISYGYYQGTADGIYG